MHDDIAVDGPHQHAHRPVAKVPARISARVAVPTTAPASSTISTVLAFPGHQAGGSALHWRSVARRGRPGRHVSIVARRLRRVSVVAVPVPVRLRQVVLITDDLAAVAAAVERELGLSIRSSIPA